MNKTRIYLYSLVFLIITIIIISLVYIQLSITTPNAETNLAARNIETPIKLLLNGYLGSLFGFNYLGNINWLVLPLGTIYFYLIKPKLQTYQKAFVLFLLLAFVLIAAKGFFNPRYQLTLLPIFVFLVFYFSWCIFEKLNQRFLKYASVSILVVLIFFNFSLQVFGNRFQEKLNKLLNKELVKSEEITQLEETPQNTEDVIYVDDLLVYIENMKTDDYFLVNNLPDFYYHTSKKGHYYWCGDDILYLSSSKKTLFTDLNTNEAQQYLAKELNCKYVYTYTHYKNYNKIFDDFLKINAVLIARDSEKLLYEINSND